MGAPIRVGIACCVHRASPLPLSESRCPSVPGGVVAAFAIPMPPKYRWVCWHAARQGWVAQAPSGNGRQVTLGLYATQLEAARAVLQHLGWQKLAQLRVRQVKPEARRYRHVTFHKGRWQARVAGAHLGACATQLAAAKLVASHEGLPSVQLLLLRRDGTRSGVQSPQSSVSDFQGVSWHRPGPRSRGGWQAQVAWPEQCSVGSGVHLPVSAWCWVGMGWLQLAGEGL